MTSPPNAVVGPPGYAVQMLRAQLFNVNTTCHNIRGSGSSVTPAVPRPLGSTLSQSDSGVIPIPTPFRCFNDRLFLPFSSAVSLEVLFIAPPLGIFTSLQLNCDNIGAPINLVQVRLELFILPKIIFKNLLLIIIK